MADKEVVRSERLEDVVEFQVSQGEEIGIDIRKVGKCGGNCNACKGPTCKQTCRSCRR